MTNAEKVAKDISNNIDFMVELLKHFDCCSSSIPCEACPFYKTLACTDGIVGIDKIRNWLESEVNEKCMRNV